jgi:membrane protease YdiL (CAAX protease family)
MKIDWQRTWYFISQFLTIFGIVFFLSSLFMWVYVYYGKIFLGYPTPESAIAALTDPGNDMGKINYLRLYQLLSNLVAFALPAYFYTRIYKYPFKSTMNLDRRVSFMQVIMVIVFAVAMLFAVELVSWFNHMIPAPDSIAEAVKSAEEAQTRIFHSMLVMPDIRHLLFCLVAMALVPGISEELMFRGILQPFFKNWTRNIHAGIFISAALFSLMHYDFHEFISRFVFALTFGYLYYWSGSLWITILAHFLNNGIEVLVSYFKDSNGFIRYLYETDNLPVYYNIAGIIVVVFVMLWFKNRHDKVT